jgi:peptidoglycan/xylan/chitin deacetylase (PgdA/CDA1 family)
VSARFVAAGATALALVATGCGDRSRISIAVGGRVEQVAVGTTLGRAAEIFGLHPRAGNLLDVEGNVLHARAFAGGLSVDGRRAASDTRLRAGDRIGVIGGRDRVERMRRSVVPVPEGLPANPQGRLVKTPGVRVIVRGAISHKLVSSDFRPTGPPKTERAVALTFDDGPSPTDTLRVLKVLRRMHVRATFFVIGYLVEAYPEIVVREQAAKMAIGNHTYNHPEVPPFAQLPRRLLDAEIELGAQRLARLGITTELLRPPAGSSSAAVVRAAQAAGERVVLWSVDPVDWPAGVTPVQIKRRVLEAVQPGSIVLLHDGGGDQSATVAALPGIIRGIRHKRLRLVPLAP